MEYHCNYCGHDFEQKVGKSGGDQHSSVSDQVKCTKCGNFLPTWGGK